MKTAFLNLTFLISLLPTVLFAQKLTKEESQLYDLIMEYRKENNLLAIPLSKSLTFVAQTHVKDLVENEPDHDSCNMHSWSDKGHWTSCCYTPDHAEAECMWGKPSELTSYKGYGYEIAYWAGFEATPMGALNTWKQSPGHNAVIINSSIWNKHKWRAIGIGIYKGYAVVWFGEERD